MTQSKVKSNLPSCKYKDDPLLEPGTAFGQLDEKRYKAEVELVERYQSFVAELLRLALLGIAVFGFLYESIFQKLPLPHSEFHIYAKWLAAISVLMFGFSAALALFFRFYSTEGARFYIEALRFVTNDEDRAKNNEGSAENNNNKAKKSLDKRCQNIDRCWWSKIGAAFLLGVGGLFAAIAFALLLITH